MRVAILILLVQAVVSFADTSCSNSLKGKTVLVTGGAKGIGYAMCHHYLLKEVRVVIIVDYNREEGLEAERKLRARFGRNKVYFIYRDVTTDSKPVLKIVNEQFGQMDIFVNNAGILNEEDPGKTIDTNLRASVEWSQAVHSQMSNSTGGTGGTIVIVASTAGFTIFPGIVAYTASKMGVMRYGLGLGHKYNFMISNVRVYVVCPGLTRTDMTLRRELDVKSRNGVMEVISKESQWQSADDVGRLAIDLHGWAVTGTAYTIMGGKPPVVSPARFDLQLDYVSLALAEQRRQREEHLESS